MCNFCEPNGWRRKTCCICGVSKPRDAVYISISIATNDPEELFPYTQTDYCKECWVEYGIVSAFEHNYECSGSPS